MPSQKVGGGGVKNPRNKTTTPKSPSSKAKSKESPEKQGEIERSAWENDEQKPTKRGNTDPGKRVVCLRKPWFAWEDRSFLCCFIPDGFGPYHKEVITQRKSIVMSPPAA